MLTSSINFASLKNQIEDLKQSLEHSELTLAKLNLSFLEQLNEITQELEKYLSDLNIN